MYLHYTRNTHATRPAQLCTYMSIRTFLIVTDACIRTYIMRTDPSFRASR